MQLGVILLDVQYCDHFRKMRRLMIGKEQRQNSLDIELVYPKDGVFRIHC